MNIKQALASVALTGTLALALPAAPAYANGAASTRNLILLGAGAAAYLIIQHNRKVHEKYAEYDRRQAALSQENNDAWAAYHQEQAAYAQQVQVNQELKKEVAYQHRVVQEQQHELAALGGGRSGFLNQRTGQRVAQRSDGSRNANTQVAMVSYGWGDI